MRCSGYGRAGALVLPPSGKVGHAGIQNQTFRRPANFALRPHIIPFNLTTTNSPKQTQEGGMAVLLHNPPPPPAKPGFYPPPPTKIHGIMPLPSPRVIPVL
jgi:hypothetical protein